jgi:eukaryotic-like serine/threonine-protein kinase
MSSASHHLPPGYLLRYHYEIVKPLSSGAFGDTYIAIDRDLPDKPQVVVKYLKLGDIPAEHQPAILRLFQKEAVSLRQLGERTTQIPKLWANFSENNDYYLVQEFVDGSPLSQELVPGQVFDEGAVIDMLREILTPLKIVHNQQIIHRDLKPDNIIRRRDNGELVLIDFGAVKEIGQMKTQILTGSASTIGIGTPGYMPDEQRAGHPRFSSDIYAVGIIAIQALTGFAGGALSQFPVNGDSLELDWLTLVQQPISAHFTALITKMVRRWYADRFVDASAALVALESIGATPPKNPQPVVTVVPQPAVPSPQPSPPPPKANTPPTYTPVSQPQPVARSNSGNMSQSAPGQSIGFPLAGRRNFLKWMGFGGTGIFLAWVWSQLGKNSLPVVDLPVVDLPVVDLPIAASLSEAGKPPKLSSIQFASIELDSKGKEIFKPQGLAQIFTESLGSDVNLTMIKIPAGKFMMGSPDSEKERKSNESPRHEVGVPEFYMGQTLVTKAQWQAIMGNDPAYFQGNGKLPVDKLPVESINWLEAMNFCEKLSQKTGRKYSLPSESQWEYACRARTTTPFAFGETITQAVVNYHGNYPYGDAPKAGYRERTTPVGSFPPNLFGLYDMHGNLWEWCLDEWVDSYEGAPSDGSARGDINSRSPDKSRLLRGGSWNLNARVCRAAFRNYYAASFRRSDFGLRVVWVPPRTP